MHNLIPLQSQLVLIVVLLFAVSFGFIGILYLTGNKRLWIIYITVLSTMALSVISFSAGYKIYQAEHYNYAIIMDESSDAKNAPDGTKILFTIHEGTKIKIIKSVGNWDFVSLSNGVSGWVKSSSLEVI